MLPFSDFVLFFTVSVFDMYAMNNGLLLKVNSVQGIRIVTQFVIHDSFIFT